MTQPLIRVVVADDHPIVRSGISSLLSLADGIDVVGEAASELRRSPSPRSSIPTSS